MVDVYLGGKFIGTVEDPEKFIAELKEQRRNNILPRDVNVMFNTNSNEVYIEPYRGRLRRPLIVVREGKSLLSDDHVSQFQKGEISWDDLISQGVIEYLDAAEEENALVAFYENELTEDHTHLEVAPLAMFGLTTSLVPFTNYNSAQKVNTGSKNQKQAIGFYAANFAVRMDMDVNLLHYPQRPLVKSIMHDIMNYDSHPAGQNICVAVMSYKGYNMEDAIVINKGSIQMGLGRGSYYRPMVSEELRYSGGLVDEVSVPDKEVKGYRSEHDYRFLEEDGIIYPEAKVAEGDVVIGKTSPPRFLSGMEEYSLSSETRRESSVGLQHGEEGIIDTVMITENSEGNKLVQVKIRDDRTPEVGDKFTSRHGQKGVIGLIVPHADMPFSANGTIPDLIFSPHGIPTRMTMAHLIELVAGKTGALTGRYVDGSVFSAEPEAEIREQLLEMGFRDNGFETLFNGETGEAFQVRIYIGSMYYLRLKHMVANKIHSRARGPIQLLTRQPTEGRAKEGGLRLGEMEKDTYVAHGASMLLKERFDSDKVTVPVCIESGLIGYYDAWRKRLVSPIHGDDAELRYVEMSFAFKLFLDELKALGIYPKLRLGNKY